MNQKNYETVSTCTRRPQCNQIISYLFVTLLLLAQYVAIVPHLEHQVSKYVLGAIFLVTFLILVLSTFQTSRIDPVDPVLVSFHNGQRSQILKIINTCLYCDSCRSYVKNSSKHCKICNRCVDHFDHHCIWINNCIGQQNYRWFIVMIFAASTYLLLFIISMAYIWMEARWGDFIGYMIFLWICLAITVPFFILLVFLTGFHCYLIYKGETTYEFLTNSKKEKEVKSHLGTHNQTELHLDNNNKVTNTYYQSQQIIFKQMNEKSKNKQQKSNVFKEPSQSSSEGRDQESSVSKSKGQKQHQNVGQSSLKDQTQQKDEHYKYRFSSRSLKMLGQSIDVRTVSNQSNIEMPFETNEKLKSKQPIIKKQISHRRGTIH